MDGKSLLITFEGIDGTGKSTQAALLAERLQAEGFDCIKTREPGGTKGAEKIRDLLTSVKEWSWSVEVEILLLTAARRDHVDRKIVPALNSGKIVICDRFIDSTRVYQGNADKSVRACIDALHESMIGVSPDLTFILDLPSNLALERIGTRGIADEYFESFGNRIENLRQGFLELAKEFHDRCSVYNASLPAIEIAEQVYYEARRRIE